MSHTHREGGPVCKYKTKKECDVAWRLHVAQQKVIFEEKMTRERSEAKATRIARFDAFIEKERLRMEGETNSLYIKPIVKDETPVP